MYVELGSHVMAYEPPAVSFSSLVGFEMASKPAVWASAETASARTEAAVKIILNFALCRLQRERTGAQENMVNQYWDMKECVTKRLDKQQPQTGSKVKGVTEYGSKKECESDSKRWLIRRKRGERWKKNRMG